MRKLSFTKMHGLGNDFMVVDATQEPFELTTAIIKQLGDRQTGVGFDQLLVVEVADEDGIDFHYRIFNTDGSEVEHCGNGARCFAKYVYDQGLSTKKTLRVRVKKGIISTRLIDSTGVGGETIVEVEMGSPILSPEFVPFAVNGKSTTKSDSYQTQYQVIFSVLFSSKHYSYSLTVFNWN